MLPLQFTLKRAHLKLHRSAKQGRKGLKDIKSVCVWEGVGEGVNKLVSKDGMAPTMIADFTGPNHDSRFQVLLSPQS